MGKSKPSHHQILGQAVLRDVSRSFYLSLRLLPAQMRNVAGLGYLLARTSDTIADTDGLKVTIRQDLLERFRNHVLGKKGDPGRHPLIQDVREDLLPSVDHAGERRLIEKMDACLEWLDDMQRDHRLLLDQVLDSITEGQLSDLDRFGDATAEHPAFLHNGAELERYAYLVAGSVGRFWTELAERSVPGYAAPPLETMIEYGEHYGRGLQWLNIIRDMSVDLRMGRCYLPKSELIEAGWREDASWRENQSALLEVARNWMDRTEAALWDGMRYTQFLRSRRLKIASALPALIGAKTLREIRKSQTGFLAKPVKIRRAEVRTILLRSVSMIALKRPLDRYFQHLLYR